MLRKISTAVLNLNKNPSSWLIRKGTSFPLSYKLNSSHSAGAPEDGSSADYEDVSKQELRKRMEKYLDEGDAEAIPSIFEAILKRKLSRKHDESDDELMEEIRRKQYPSMNDMGSSKEEEVDEEHVGNLLHSSDESSSDED